MIEAYVKKRGVNHRSGLKFPLFPLRLESSRPRRSTASFSFFLEQPKVTLNFNQ